jgi:hypothetical protein
MLIKSAGPDDYKSITNIASTYYCSDFKLSNRQSCICGTAGPTRGQVVSTSLAVLTQSRGKFKKLLGEEQKKSEGRWPSAAGNIEGGLHSKFPSKLNTV